jgi:DNA-binding response OmpR family regulator
VRVLIVEDEEAMANVIARGLRDENHSVVVVHDGADALEVAARDDFDVMVLDVMIPRMTGLEVAKRLRRSGNTTPIVMLTARDAINDIVGGLDGGADDYLTKPFAFEELLARLRNASRRRGVNAENVLRVADLALDPASHRVARGDIEVSLSATEFRLLEFLMRRAGRTVRRESLIEAVWGFDSDASANTLDAFVHLLRTKIDHGHATRLLRTVRGVGYCIAAP